MNYCRIVAIESLSFLNIHLNHTRTRTVARGVWMQDGCATLRDLVGDQSANVRTVFAMNGSRHHGEAR